MRPGGPLHRLGRFSQLDTRRHGDSPWLAWYIPEFADWLHRRWDEHYASDSPNRRLKRMEIVFHLKDASSPGLSSTLIVPDIVFAADYE